MQLAPSLSMRSSFPGHRWSSSASASKAKGGFSRTAGMALGAMVFPVTATFMLWGYNPEPSSSPQHEEGARLLSASAASHQLGGPFELTNCVTKQRMSEKDLFEGKWTFFYFGFSKCAEICPNTMKFIVDVMNQCDRQLADHKEELKKLQCAFVSVDHIRDDPDTLKAFISRYPRTVGLCGKRSEIATAAAAWRVYFSSVDETEEEKENREKKGSGGIAAPNPTDDSYQLDHSAAIYLVGPDGRLKDFFFREIGIEHTVERVGMHFDDMYGLNSK